ncbi:MAG TPA: DUF3426 domain-containing protein [Gammaproteobacteria bacterium]|nr:DUF3426 domain-containing protein [Gammaproteobacteria bacterium]
MLTRCTTCNTWFRLGQGDIRAAHGEVRCGACGARFNALATLCDTLPADAVEYAPSAPQPAAEPADIQRPQEEFETPSDMATADEPVEAIFSDAKPARSEPVIEPEPVNDGPETVDPEPALVEPVLPADEPIKVEPRTDRSSSVPAEPEGKRRTVPTWIWWTVGSVVLLLALLSQVIIYEHEALRANPVTRGAVEALYSAFGHPLPLRQDLSALAVTDAQVSAATKANNALVVTAALTNHADFAQAWPLLRVVLTDRFGGVVAQGVYDAGSYLPHGPVTGSALAAGQTRKVELQIADPGADAVGFVIVPCLPGENGPVCAENAQRG